MFFKSKIANYIFILYSIFVFFFIIYGSLSDILKVTSGARNIESALWFLSLIPLLSLVFFGLSLLTKNKNLLRSTKMFFLFSGLGYLAIRIEPITILIFIYSLIFSIFYKIKS